MLESIANIGAGGAGLSDAIPATLREMQGLTFSLLAGAAGGAKNNLAAIRPEDTIVAALNNNAGTITDIKATTSIAGVSAAGTITLTSVATDATVTVAGRTYTAKAVVTDPLTQFLNTGSDTADAASLAAAINARETRLDRPSVSATSDLGVVTVTAVAEGTGGNAITLAKVGASIAVSGATLAGGTATGGIITVGATNQVLLLWFNKR